MRTAQFNGAVARFIFIFIAQLALVVHVFLASDCSASSIACVLLLASFCFLVSLVQLQLTRWLCCPSQAALSVQADVLAVWVLEVETTVQQLNLRLLAVYGAMILIYLSYTSTTANMLTDSLAQLFIKGNCSALTITS
jgi:hypothetical protein